MLVTLKATDEVRKLMFETWTVHAPAGVVVHGMVVSSWLLGLKTPICTVIGCETPPRVSSAVVDQHRKNGQLQVPRGGTTHAAPLGFGVVVVVVVEAGWVVEVVALMVVVVVVATGRFWQEGGGGRSEMQSNSFATSSLEESCRPWIAPKVSPITVASMSAYSTMVAPRSRGRAQERSALGRREMGTPARPPTHADRDRRPGDQRYFTATPRGDSSASYAAT